MPLPMPLTGRRIALACAGAAALAPPLGAAPIEVSFKPPEIAANEVCVARLPEHELVPLWRDWDGTALPDRPVALVRRDLRLLQQSDPERWAETIRTANDLMLAEVESYDETDRMLDRIDLLIALDDIETLREEKLAETLLELVETGATTSAQMTAAKLLREGIGVPADPERAQEIVLEAAYAGHSSAILRMAELTANGAEIPDWTIDPEVAVTLAFGALLGDIDDRICDRINQIASHYEQGDVVAQDVDLAEDWYRMSARLGGSNGAWSVAQMHMSAEQITRDTTVMVAHLQQAADAGLTYAMLKLGRIYERGALVERDLAKAGQLYAKAAENGDPAALTRLVNLKRDAFDGSPEARAEIIGLLTEMTELPEPPAWAFSRLGNMVLEHEGRWAGEARAVAAFERALEIDPYQVPARNKLGGIAMRHVETPQDFADVTSTLRRVVSANGRSGPMQELQAAYMCRGPGAPMPEKRDYWAEMERISGDKTVDLSPMELRRLSREDDPLVVAQLQTQALNSRATSMANLLTLREANGTADELDPLLSILERTGANTQIALAKVDRALGQTDAAEAHLRQAIEANETGAVMDLVQLLRDSGPEGREARAEIVELLRPLAESGDGEAIRALIELDGETDAETAWARYGDAIERNGDFAALVFALPRLGAPERVDDYLGRIRAVMECHTPKALDLARALHGLDREAEAQHWLDVAEATSRNGWEYVATADTLLDLATNENDATAEAAALYRRGTTAGYPLAIRRLLNMAKAGAIELPKDRQVKLYVEMINGSPNENIPSVLQMIEFAEDQVRDRVEARIDRRELYRQSAEAGNARSQLELAKMIQDEAETAGDLDRYAELLRAAAEQGQPDAMLRMSRAYSYGFGVERSAEKSDKWLRRAAEAGHPEAIRTARMLDTAKEPTQ